MGMASVLGARTTLCDRLVSKKATRHQSHRSRIFPVTSCVPAAYAVAQEQFAGDIPLNSQKKQKLILIAVAGLAAGIYGCGGSTPPPDAAAKEPAMEMKDGMNKEEMPKEEMKGDAPAPAPSAEPAKP